ncbi:MAG: hypothetical protein E4H16_01145 [Candidatus Atribacteria bacterium]|nr:MAG: hypothetical protein E4H16_01145 [Candidatus Atribacteria bacterium]
MMKVTDRDSRMDEPGTLIKFGKLEHLQQLQDEGILYLNHLPYFWNIEDEELRVDPFDCAVQVLRGPKVTMVMPNGNEMTVCRDYTMRSEPPEPERINIFCMYALRPEVETFPVDQRNLRFGDNALVLLDSQQFMDRIASSLEHERIAPKAGFVEYVDNEYIGEMGPFKKLRTFSYQSEWRLVCYDGPGKPREIRIGSIRDISVIISSDEVNSEIRVDFESVVPPDRLRSR